MGVEYLEGELLKVKHELYESKIEFEKQESKINQLISENTRLTKENQILQAQLIKIQDKLNINSSNSGLPTSKGI